jgi:hypothetical protein
MNSIKSIVCYIQNIGNGARIIRCFGRKLATCTAETDSVKRKCMGTTISGAAWQVDLVIFSFKSLQEEMAHMEGGSGGKTGEVPHEQYQQLEEHCN